MPGTKWVLFDIGGVLETVDDETWPDRFMARWLEYAGVSAADFRARVDAARLPAIDREIGTEAAYWEIVGAALGLGSEDTARMRAQMWDAYCGELNRELVDFARSVARRAGLAILSNSVDGAREEEERRYRFSEVFDPICYSHELGAAKPERAAYQAALDRMGAAPADVLFIDDHEAALAGARAVGIRAVLHRENAETIAAIRQFLAAPA